MKLQREVFKVMQYHAAVDDISDITYQLKTRPGTWIPWLHGHKPRVSRGITVQQDSGAHFRILEHISAHTPSLMLSNSWPCTSICEAIGMAQILISCSIITVWLLPTSKLFCKHILRFGRVVTNRSYRQPRQPDFTPKPPFRTVGVVQLPHPVFSNSSSSAMGLAASVGAGGLFR